MDAESGGTVFIYGDFRFDRLAASYRRAFQDAGWTVVPCDTGNRSDHLAWWLTNRITHRFTIRSLTFRRAGSQAWNQYVRTRGRAAEPDLALIIRGDYLTRATVQELSNRTAHTVVFFPDVPFPESNNYRPEHREVARAADHCLIWSRSLAERLEGEWNAEAEYLPFGWDPKVFPPGEGTSAARHKVVFIGGWDRWREKWLAPVARDFDLKIWGPDYWKKRTRDPAVRRCWQGGVIRGPEAADVVRKSAVVLNIFRRQNLPDGTNMRTFEVPGAGGFLLSHRSEGAEEIFRAEEAAAYFDTRAELTDQIARYLSAPEMRETLAGRAHEITRTRHRYVDRVQTILQSLNSKGEGREDVCRG